jgi:hypothetical protein
MYTTILIIALNVLVFSIDLGFAQESKKPVAAKPAAPPTGTTQNPGISGGKPLTMGEC